MATARSYCRFCAEEKPYEEIANLTSQENQQSLIEKLTVLGLAFVDFSNKILPETVCISCYELTTLSCEFFLKVKRSQVVLSELCEDYSKNVCAFPNYETVKAESDDGEYLQDDHLPSFEDVESLVKEEKYEYGGTEVFFKDTKSSNIEKSKNIHLKSKKKTWDAYPWQCSICHISRDSLSDLRVHCQTEHLKCFAFKCADCEEGQEGFEEFVAHVRGHRKGLRSYCEHCNIKLEDSTHYAAHAQCCARCGAGFDSVRDLYEHRQRYDDTYDGAEIASIAEIRTWSDYPSICQYCHLKVMDKAVLIEHCIEAHQTCFGSQCVDCDVRLDCFRSFFEHVVIHRPYLKNICPYCNTDMATDPSHISKHASARTCPLCGVTFHLKRHLRAHQRTTKQSPLIKPRKRRRGPPSDKNSTCPICGMIMKTPASLKGHLQTHTDRKRNYTCESCGKAYYTKGSLDVHRKIHDKTVKEACQICHKTFLTIPRLKKHVKTHNLEMPYQCDSCKRFFNSKDRLREHVKVHMDILPFKCSYCAKKFRHKSIMKTHENQHTGARPYSCNICCMDFANWSNCNKHMKRKHGTTLAKNIMTPRGKLALNPETGKPDQLFMDNKVKEWSEIMLMGRDKKNYHNKVS